MSIGTANELVTDIEQRVSSGHLRPGDRLPSVRSEAERLGLAPNTVAAAYRRLRDRGVAAGRGRRGTVIAERPLVAPVIVADVPPGVVDAMTGNPDQALLPDLAPAFRKALAAPPSRYGQELLDPDLGRRARELLEADGVDATHLTVVSGAMDAVERLLLAHLRAGDSVGIEDPGYAAVHQLVVALGFEAVPIEIDQAGVLPSALSGALDAGVAAVVLTPRSHNPTGAAFTVQRAADIDAVLATRPDVFVVEDDHAGPVSGADAVVLNHERRPWAVVRSVSKSLGPDLRVAVVAGDRDTIDRVEGRLQVGPGWVSHLLQRAVAFLLSDPATQERVEQAARTYTRRRRRLIDALGHHGIHAVGASGLHVWVPVRDEQAVVAALHDKGLAVRAGENYRVGTPPAVRVTTAALSDDELDAVAAAITAALSPSRARSRIA